jgi:hypothetical protein
MMKHVLIWLFTILLIITAVWSNDESVLPEVSPPGARQLSKYQVLTTPQERLQHGVGDRLLKPLGWQELSYPQLPPTLSPSSSPSSSSSSSSSSDRQQRLFMHITHRAHENTWWQALSVMRKYPADTWVSSFPFLSFIISHKGEFVRDLLACNATVGVPNCGVFHPVSYYYYPVDAATAAVLATWQQAPWRNISSLPDLQSLLRAQYLPRDVTDPQCWVYKEVHQDAFGGRGLEVFLSTAALLEFLGKQNARASGLIQEYVADPLLVDGHKASPAIYFLVTSLRPLQLYFFDMPTQAIVIAADPFVSPKHAATSRGHVTNIDSNFKQPTFSKFDFDKTQGTLRAMEWYFDDYLPRTFPRPRVELLWSQLLDQVIRSVGAALPRMQERLQQLATTRLGHFRYFHLMRADFQLTDTLTPYILEINQIPLHDCDAGRSFYQKIPRWRCDDYDTYRDAMYKLVGLTDDRFHDKIEHLTSLLTAHLNRTAAASSGTFSDPSSSTIPVRQLAIFVYEQLAQRVFDLPLTLSYPTLASPAYHQYDDLMGATPRWSDQLLQELLVFIDQLE